MLRRASLASLLALVACGDEAQMPPTSNACGTAGELSGMECAGLDGCGAGPQNFKKVTPCDHCLASADSHFCEAGVCRALPTTPAGLGTIKAAFSLRQLGAGAQGLAQAAILPVMADGTKISCAALMSTCGFKDSPAINALSSSVNVMPGDVVFSFATIDPGPGRLYFAEFTSELRGRGTVLAKGCVEGLEIVAGETKEVSVELVAP